MDVPKRESIGLHLERSSVPRSGDGEGGEDLDVAYSVVPVLLTSSELLESGSRCFIPSPQHCPDAERLSIDVC